MSRRTSGGFSCFTIDALIGNSHDSSPPPPVSGSNEWSASSDYRSPTLQYVVSCSGLEDVCRSPAPTTNTTLTTSNLTGLQQQQSVDDVGGGSRHAFRVYRPASLDGVASNPRSQDSAQLQYGILATLQRRAMKWYSSDVDNDRWRTPTSLCDVSTAGRRINNIISTSMSPTGRLHSNCEYNHHHHVGLLCNDKPQCSTNKIPVTNNVNVQIRQKMLIGLLKQHTCYEITIIIKC